MIDSTIVRVHIIKRPPVVKRDPHEAPGVPEEV
jgi:hypothetical protein